MSGNIKVEFTIEPFVEGSVPPYVQAAVDALAGIGVATDIGPFGTAFQTTADKVGAAVAAVMNAAYANGATYVTVDAGPAE